MLFGVLCFCCVVFFFFKQKTAYEVRISDWSSDVCSSDLKVDPVADAETVETELLLSDLESLEKRVPAFAKKAAQGDKEAKIAASVLGQALDLLREGKPARLTEPKDEEEARVLRTAQLLTSKPVLYVCNVDEGSAANGNAFSEKVFVKAAAEGAQARSEEHTSELQSLMRISYAVFC